MELAEYKTKSKIYLPFKGTWIVANGGRDAGMNNHISPDESAPSNQTYAYDFVKDYTGEGKELSDYEAFGQEVISPADGIVDQVIDGNRDVPIGETDWDVVTGNMVMIDHENGEYSVLAHFKYDSIKVKVGDKVKRGDLLGLCGNTGNTSEPHIHYHLQDNPVMYKASGLPIQFHKILVNDQVLQNIELVREQKVSNVDGNLD